VCVCVCVCVCKEGAQVLAQVCASNAMRTCMCICMSQKAVHAVRDTRDMRVMACQPAACASMHKHAYFSASRQLSSNHFLLFVVHVWPCLAHVLGVCDGQEWPHGPDGWVFKAAAVALDELHQLGHLHPQHVMRLLWYCSLGCMCDSAVVCLLHSTSWDTCTRSMSCACFDTVRVQ